jgi:hypothetical protein
VDHINRRFERATLPPGAAVCDARFVDCAFVDCAIYTDDASFARVERTSFTRTTLKSKHIGKVILREVTIDTCRRNPTFVVSNCLFDRVTMRGDLGSWMIAWLADHLSPAQAMFAASFYDTVDWALDIRAARFTQLTLRGVPGEKVRRDPERHGLLRKERLLADRSWEGYPDKGLVAVLRATLDRPAESEILCANELSRTFAAATKRLTMLRAAGFAE